MSKFRGRQIGLVLSIAAIAVAGCGSSSKSKTTATSLAPSSTSTTTATTAKLTASTPITDPAVHATLVAAARQSAPAHVTTAQLNQLASCVLKKLEANGVKTVGELANHQSEAKSLAVQCAQQIK